MYTNILIWREGFNLVVMRPSRKWTPPQNTNPSSSAPHSITMSKGMLFLKSKPTIISEFVKSHMLMGDLPLI